MTKSTLLVQDADPNLLSAPHTVDASGKMIVSPVFPYNRAHAPSSTLYSNVLEMSLFSIACLNRGKVGNVRVLQPETVDAMWSPQFVSTSSFWSHVGLTWGIGQQKRHTRPSAMAAKMWALTPRSCSHPIAGLGLSY